MKVLSHPVLVCFAAMLLLTACRKDPEPTAMETAGAWPDFLMEPLEGGPAVPVGIYAGKVLLLSVWAPWEGTGRYEIQVLNALQQSCGKRGFQVAGLVLDRRPRDRVVADVEELKPVFPCFLPAENLPRPLDTFRALPVKFLVGRDGRLYGRYSGVTPVETLTRDIEQILALDPHP